MNMTCWQIWNVIRWIGWAIKWQVMVTPYPFSEHVCGAVWQVNIMKYDMTFFVHAKLTSKISHNCMLYGDWYALNEFYGKCAVPPDFKWFSAMQLIFKFFITYHIYIYIYIPRLNLFLSLLCMMTVFCVVTKKTIISLYEILKIKQTRINHTGWQLQIN